MSLSSILGLGEFTGEEFHKDHILVTIRGWPQTCTGPRQAYVNTCSIIPCF